MEEPGEMTHRYTKAQKDYLEPVFDERVKHKDFMHLKNLYTLLHEWLVEEAWASRSDPDFGETLYLHRFSQESGQELWIWWRFKKVLNSYYCWDLDVDWHIIGLKETEVMHNGVKYKANFGEVEFKIYAKQIADWQDKWKEHWFLKHWQKILWKRIFKKDFDFHKQELLREVRRMLEAIKTYLKLKTYLPEPEGQKFYPTREFD